MKYPQHNRIAAVTMIAATLAFPGAPAVAAESLMIQGSSTVSARLLTPYKDAIEAKSGQKLDVNASKSAGAARALHLQPLRQVLRMNDSEFAEGIFCWKGFIYWYLYS